MAKRCPSLWLDAGNKSELTFSSPHRLLKQRSVLVALLFLHYFLAHTVWCLAAVLGQCHSPTGEANLFLVSPAAAPAVLPLCSPVLQLRAGPSPLFWQDRTGLFRRRVVNQQPQYVEARQTASHLPWHQKHVRGKQFHHHPVLPQLFGTAEENYLSHWKGLDFRICAAIVKTMLIKITRESPAAVSPLRAPLWHRATVIQPRWWHLLTYCCCCHTIPFPQAQQLCACSFWVPPPSSGAEEGWGGTGCWQHGQQQWKWGRKPLHAVGCCRAGGAQGLGTHCCSSQPHQLPAWSSPALRVFCFAGHDGIKDLAAPKCGKAFFLQQQTTTACALK